VLRKIFGPKEGRANREVEKFYALYSSNIIRVIKARQLRLAGHIACMEERKLHAGFLVGKPEGERPGKPRPRWVNNIKMGYMDWIHLAQDTGRWKVLGNATMNLQNVGNFLTN
jgi:hypothetical protein